MAEYVMNTNKTLNEIQKDSLKIFGKYNLEKSLIWMVEEFGEVFQAIRKNKNISDVTEEIGDLLSWIICISNILNIDINNAIKTNFSKEINRQLNRYGKLKYCDNIEFESLYKI